MLLQQRHAEATTERSEFLGFAHSAKILQCDRVVEG